MKRFFSLLMIIVFVLSCCLFGSCGKDDEKKTAETDIPNISAPAEAMQTTARDVTETVFASEAATGTTLPEAPAIDVEWAIDAEGTLTISGRMKDYDTKDNTAPWYSEKDEIRKVIINNGVTKIGDYAFYRCDSLTTITIPDGVTEIGEGAFEYCDSLKSIIIPDGVTKIGEWAFNRTSLASINIPDSVTEIGEGAFRGCLALMNVTIPASVTIIGAEAFDFCVYLKSVTIPDSVTEIGEGAFRSCSDDLVIICPAGSYAETYAKENGIKVGR